MISNEDLYKSITKITYRDSITGDVFLGSGVIFSHDGLVLTNNHIIENQDFETVFGDITVHLTTDETKPPLRQHKAELIIRNNFFDLAVLKIDQYSGKVFIPILQTAMPVKPLEKRIKVIGYPGIGGDTITITRGILSGFDGVKNIKTDAEINPGNSGGGAFFEEDNSFVGIPSFIIRSKTGKIGFIITKKRIAAWLRKTLIVGIPKNKVFNAEQFEKVNYECEGNLDRTPKLHKTFGHRVFGQFAAVEMLLQDSQPDRVFPIIKKILIQRPRSPLAYQYQGNAYLALKDYLSAIDSYETALSLDTGASKINLLGNYAIALALINRFEKAIEINNLIVETTDKNNEKACAFNNLGQIYENLGQKSLAISYYSKALRTDPQNIIAKTNKDRLHKRRKNP